MRRFAVRAAVIVGLFSTVAAWAGEGKVSKVLPQFLDKKGRAALNPSLYERDAYQFYLRRRPELRDGLRLAVEWKAKKVDWQKLQIRAELRGQVTNTLQTITLEQPVKKGGFLGSWANFDLTGEQYKKFGELVAWRVTLFEGDKQLGQLESFLWSGVVPKSP
jgi:hypothetical protein